jgi:Tfp pilus assembly protein PilN
MSTLGPSNPTSAPPAAATAGGRSALPSAPRVLAALHIQGDSARLALAQVDAGRLTLAQTQTLPASDLAGIERLLDERGVELLIRVLPAAHTVCRTAALPAAENGALPPPDALAGAIDLLAEGELPSSLPWWRRSGGMIALGGKSAALLLGWPDGPQKSGGRAPKTAWPCPDVFIAEPAALAHLAAIAETPIAVSTDRAAGSLALVAAGREKLVARTLRLPGGEASWATGVARAVSETASAAGLAAPALRPGVQDPQVHLPGKPPVLAGQPRDPAFINTFGLAVAALELWASADPLRRGFFSLFQAEPVEKAPFYERVVRWFARPWRAAAAILVGLALFLGLPLAIAQTRLDLLTRSIGDVEAMRARLAASEQNAAFYELLRDRRWPMTKLLADISGAAPEGVRLEAVELATGETVSIRGIGETNTLVTTFRENLAATRVFTQVTTPTTGRTADGVTFQLQAKIEPRTAVFPVTPKDDFAAKTLAQRMYGDDAVSSAGAAPVRRDPIRPRPQQSPRAAEPAVQAPASAGSAGSTAPARRPPPEPISDDQIARLNAGQAMLEFAKRQSASRTPGLDAATRQRLTDEVAKILAHREKLRQSGGGGGAR